MNRTTHATAKLENECGKRHTHKIIDIYVHYTSNSYTKPLKIHRAQKTKQQTDYEHKQEAKDIAYMSKNEIQSRNVRTPLARTENDELALWIAPYIAYSVARS